MKGITTALCLLMALTGMAFGEIDDSQGTIAKPGYSYLSPLYANSIDNSRSAALRDRWGASYAAENNLIPGQILVVAPRTGSTFTSKINAGNIEDAASNFLSASGILPAGIQLNVISRKFIMGKRWFINFKKSIEGIPIEDAGIGLIFGSGGNVDLLWGDLNMNMPRYGDFSLAQEVAQDHARQGLEGNITNLDFMGKSILPLYFGDRTEYHPAYKFMIITQEPYAEWETYVDAGNGELLQRVNKVYNDIISGNASGSIQPGYPTDPWSDATFFDMDLNFNGYDPVTTDIVGHYSLETVNSDPLDVYINLTGPFLQVMNDAGGESQIYDTVDPPATYDVYWDDSNSTAPERDAWYSGIRVHRWIRILDPDLTVMDFPMVCNVNVAGSCNAFWAGGQRTINFYRAGGGCPNIAQIADVVYHEYGHGITDLQTRPNGPNGAMHEGFSDYLACTITNQPLVGVGFFLNQPNEPLRNLDNNRRYPEDWSGESHNDGMIIGGALWHTRQALSPYPLAYVDSLWHYARYAMTQDFEPYFWAFVALDDDDNDLSNGTPNAATIFYNFGDRHGIGPGTRVNIAADALFDSEDTTRTFTVSASVSSVFELLPDSVLLYYDSGSGFQSVAMGQTDSIWSGDIPAQRNDTHVNYYILAVDRAGFRGTSPAGAPGVYFSFYVGPDIIAPTLSLIEGPVNTVNVYGPFGPFVISAADINGINPSFTRLHYSINTEPERTEYLTADTGGVFRLPLLDLSRQLFTGDTIHYYFTAVDGAHRPNSGRLPLSGTFSLVMVTSEVFENFERSGMDRWTVDDGWILRNDGYVSGHSIWFSSPNYPNNANASIAMNFDYDLSPYNGARLTFYRKNLIRSGDTCLVEASNNGGITWTRIGSITGLVAPIYQQMEVDMAPVLDPGSHHYKVRFRFVSDDTSTWVGVFLDDIGWSVDAVLDGLTEEAALPKDMALHQNYPNPFNPETKIQFSMPSNSAVRLEIFDILGRQVSTLVDKELRPGDYSVTWNGTDNSNNPVASGIYFYRLTTNYGVRQQKMTLLR